MRGGRYGTCTNRGHESTGQPRSASLPQRSRSSEKLASSPNENAPASPSISCARSSPPSPSPSTTPKMPSSRSAACSSALRCAATCAGESGAVVEAAERREEDDPGRESGRESGGGRGRVPAELREDVEGGLAASGLLVAEVEGPALVAVVRPGFDDVSPSLDGGCMPPRAGAREAPPVSRAEPGVADADAGATARRAAVPDEPTKGLRADPAALEPASDDGTRARPLVLEASDDVLAGLAERGARRLGAGKSG